MELRWVVGILEGEGSFRLIQPMTPAIQVKMTDQDVIQRVGKFLQATASYMETLPSGKAMYGVKFQGHKAAEWMMIMYTLLGQRRKAQVRKALSAWRSHRQPNPNNTPNRRWGVRPVRVSMKDPKSLTSILSRPSIISSGWTHSPQIGRVRAMCDESVRRILGTA